MRVRGGSRGISAGRTARVERCAWRVEHPPDGRLPPHPRGPDRLTSAQPSTSGGVHGAQRAVATEVPGHSGTVAGGRGRPGRVQPEDVSVAARASRSGPRRGAFGAGRRTGGRGRRPEIWRPWRNGPSTGTRPASSRRVDTTRSCCRGGTTAGCSSSASVSGSSSCTCWTPPRAPASSMTSGPGRRPGAPRDPARTAAGVLAPDAHPWLPRQRGPDRGRGPLPPARGDAREGARSSPGRHDDDARRRPARVGAADGSPPSSADSLVVCPSRSSSPRHPPHDSTCSGRPGSSPWSRSAGSTR